MPFGWSRPLHIRCRQIWMCIAENMAAIHHVHLPPNGCPCNSRVGPWFYLTLVAFVCFPEIFEAKCGSMRSGKMILESFGNLSRPPSHRPKETATKSGSTHATSTQYSFAEIDLIPSTWRLEFANCKFNPHLHTYWNSKLSSKNTSHSCFCRFIRSVHGTLQMQIKAKKAICHLRP